MLYTINTTTSLLNEIADDVRIDKWLSTVVHSCPQLSSIGVSSGQIITAAGLMLLLLHFRQGLIPSRRSSIIVLLSRVQGLLPPSRSSSIIVQGPGTSTTK